MKPTRFAAPFAVILSTSSLAVAQAPPPQETPLPAPTAEPPDTPADLGPPVRGPHGRRGTQPPVETLKDSAEKAAVEAQHASSSEEAKSNLARAVDAKKAIDALTPPEAPSAKQAAAAVKRAELAVDEKKRAEESLCGMRADATGPRAFCVVYGIFAAALSQVRVDGEGSDDGPVSGQSSQRLTSIAVPFAGIRFMPQAWFTNHWGFVSLDVAGYSAFLTQSVSATSPNAPKASCSTRGGDFEQRLPCEADATVHPYLGAYVGITVGKAGLAYLTLIPFTVGTAQVGSMPDLRTYYGWSVGALQLNGSL